jgi:hypothetical protein
VKGVKDMGTKAYFMINVDSQTAQLDNYYVGAVNELTAIPEVECVEPVSGIYDLMVKVDVPIRVVLVANKILAKEWVKRLHVLKVEPIEPERVEPIEHERVSEPSVKEVMQS